MSAPHKFLFDRSFDQAEGPHAISLKPPPAPSLTRADVDAARTQGTADGRKAALAEAMRSAEERTASALSALAAGIAEMLTTHERDAGEAQRRSLETLRAIVRKVVPALCRKNPLIEVEAVVAECLHEAFEEPRIVLRVADTLFPPLRERLDGLIASTGFAGKIVLLADETLDPGDARVEWADGGTERNSERLLSDIDAALTRAVDATSPTPAKLIEESKP
jgi:flagellar assembly protein FliH